MPMIHLFFLTLCLRGKWQNGAIITVSSTHRAVCMPTCGTHRTAKFWITTARPSECPSEDHRKRKSARNCRRRSWTAWRAAGTARVDLRHVSKIFFNLDHSSETDGLSSSMGPWQFFHCLKGLCHDMPYVSYYQGDLSLVLNYLSELLGSLVSCFYYTYVHITNTWT